MTDSTKQSEINSTCEVSNETARKAHGSNRLDESNPAVLELASNSAQNRSYGNSSADWTLVLKKGKPKWLYCGLSTEHYSSNYENSYLSNFKQESVTRFNFLYVKTNKNKTDKINN